MRKNNTQQLIVVGSLLVAGLSMSAPARTSLAATRPSTIRRVLTRTSRPVWGPCRGTAGSAGHRSEARSVAV